MTDVSASREIVGCHKWRVGERFTVTLIVDARPYAGPARTVWRPFAPRHLTKREEAEYQAGIESAIEKLRRTFGEQFDSAIAFGLRQAARGQNRQ
jgi:hypothetical protein